MSASFLRPPSSDSHMLYAFVIAQLLRESRYHGEDPVAACFFFMASATEQEFSDLSRDELCSLYFGRTLHSGLGQPEHFLVPPNRLGPVRVGKRDSTKEGRGLFVTRTVQPGELLLVSNPLVAAPVEEVFETFKAAQEVSAAVSLEQLTVEEVVDQLAELTSQSSEAVAIIRSLADEHSQDMPLPNLDMLNKSAEEVAMGGDAEVLDRAFLRSVITTNAYGPDFKNYEQISRDLQSGRDCSVYRRLLGLYVIPSLINHACESNATRVFVGETMLVRATRVLQEGEEIVWPYLPPLKTLLERQQHLRTAFHFDCRCRRCTTERGLGRAYSDLQKRVVEALGAQPSKAELARLVKEVEEELKTIGSGDTRRMAMASFLNLYYAFFNSLGGSLDDAKESEALRLQMQLYLALVIVNNVSTEHLSLIHTAYETSVAARGADHSTSRFWMERLQQAHATRYGSTLSNYNRQLYRHTRHILRDREGFYKEKPRFL